MGRYPSLHMFHFKNYLIDINTICYWDSTLDGVVRTYYVLYGSRRPIDVYLAYIMLKSPILSK